MDAQPGGRAEAALVEKFEKFRVAFVNAQHFVRGTRISFRKALRAKFPAQFGDPSKQRHAVRAAAVTSEAFDEQLGHFGRNAMLEFLRFFVRARPGQADHVSKKLFRQPVPQHKVFGDLLPFWRKRYVAVAQHADVAIARHALHGGCYGGRGYAKLLSQTRADRRLLFLNKLPDRLKVIFLRDACLFAPHASISLFTPPKWRSKH